MAELLEVNVSPRRLERFREVLGDAPIDRALAAAEQLSTALQGHVIWNVNSTAVGGGVAEMLQPLLGYARGVGVDTRWVVIQGEPEFFNLTKRIHHALHGSAGDGRPLAGDARAVYEATAHHNAAELSGLVRAGSRHDRPIPSPSLLARRSTKPAGC